MQVPPFGFDPNTSCHERTLDEIWLPYARPEDQRMRDDLWGSTPEEYQSMLDYEESVRAADVLAAQQAQWAEHQARIAQISKVLWGEQDQDTDPLPAAPQFHSVVRLVPALRRARSQTTTHIHRDSFFRIYEGLLFANYQGFVFNVELTISWEQGGYLTPTQIDAAFEAFLQRFRKFAEHRDVEPRYYAVFENGDKLGYHSHIHMSFPHARRKELRAWLASSLRGADGTEFPKTAYQMNVHKDDHVTGQWYWFRYLMKGLDPKLLPSERRELGLDVPLNRLMGLERRDTGLIEIKRVRHARQIGEAAQKKEGYIVWRSFFALPERDRYSAAEYRRGIADRRLAYLAKALAIDDI